MLDYIKFFLVASNAVLFSPMVVTLFMMMSDLI